MTSSFSNLQPSLALNELIVIDGLYPSNTGTAEGDTIGFIDNFAGLVLPVGAEAGLILPEGADQANGALLKVSSNSALFSLLGVDYGGNGTTNFALPDLAGQVLVGAASGRSPGLESGSTRTTLTQANLPAPQGSDTPFSNLEPSTSVEMLICVSGDLPALTGASKAPVLGEVAAFAGGVVPSGWMVAQGQTLSIDSNPRLFAVLGVAYGGDGIKTFALPNLAGADIIGAGETDDADYVVGHTYGNATTTLKQANLPPQSQPIDNDQPSVAMQYMICTSGVYPTSGYSATEPTLGQVIAFAGPEHLPAGFSLADGQVLPIHGNEVLFSVIGTLYGGNGTTDFALPDLTGRTIIGADAANYALGQDYGADSITLTSANLPCYVRGTRIATTRGPVAVEDLVIGDRALTASGGERPVIWLGRRALDLTRHPAPASVEPVLVEPGAFADRTPERDLWLSPCHCVAIEDALVPIIELCNGRTIRQVPLGKVEYWHVELDEHDIILAEGLAAESYLDTGNRAAFANGGVLVEAHPDFARRDWAETCRPLCVDGPVPRRARAALLERALAFGGLESKHCFS